MSFKFTKIQDPDQHCGKKLNPDPHKFYADPKHCMHIMLILVDYYRSWESGGVVRAPWMRMLRALDPTF